MTITNYRKTVFFIHTLSNDVQSFMHYDYIMNQFVIGIKKTSGSKTTVITMDEIECHGFLTKSMNVGGTILFVKENAYKRGEIDFDIRKCAKKDDGEFGYSKHGVRLKMDGILPLQEKLQLYMSTTESLVKQTSRCKWRN